MCIGETERSVKCFRDQRWAFVSLEMSGIPFGNKSNNRSGAWRTRASWLTQRVKSGHILLIRTSLPQGGECWEFGCRAQCKPGSRPFLTLLLRHSLSFGRYEERTQGGARAASALPTQLLQSLMAWCRAGRNSEITLSNNSIIFEWILRQKRVCWQMSSNELSNMYQTVSYYM